MSERQDPNHDQEDDLLADFQGVVRSDGAEHDPPQRGDEELAELDAFLNEFGQSGSEADADVTPSSQDDADIADFADVPELEEVAAEEVVPELGTDDIVLAAAPSEELDLDVEHVAESVAPEALDDYVSDLDEHQQAPAAPSNASPEVPDLFDTDSVTSHGAADYLAADDELIADEEEAQVGRRLDISTIGVALFSLVVAAVVGWFAVSLHSQVSALRSEVARLGQKQPAAVTVAPNPQVDAQLAQLTRRLNDLAASVTASVGHTSVSQNQLDTVNSRLDDLGKAVATLRDQFGAMQKAQARRPAAAPTPVRQATRAVKSGRTASAAQGAWVVNVASLTDQKAAQAELARLQHDGIKNTQVDKVEMKGQTWYRVRVTGFASREEAQVYSDMIKNKLAATPWVGPR